jgi:hypothetical protein
VTTGILLWVCFVLLIALALVHDKSDRDIFGERK